MTGQRHSESPDELPDDVPARLERDVRALSATPRHRSLPGALPAARRYCTEQLQQAGWQVKEHRFTGRPALRTSDRGKPGSRFPLRWTERLSGVNLVAAPGRAPQAGDTLVIAHLDTVRPSPGADDNASGVAVALEVARQLRGADHRTVVALVDLEEVGHLGAHRLVHALPRPGLVVCLESVGFYDRTPGSQHVPPGFGLLFPALTRSIRAHQDRGDFVLAVHRRASAGFAQRWAAAARDTGVRPELLRDPRWSGRGQRFTRWLTPPLLDLDSSDHSPFWRQRVPAVMLTATAPMRNARYHRAEDTPDTLDYAAMSALAASVAASLSSTDPGLRAGTAQP